MKQLCALTARLGFSFFITGLGFAAEPAASLAPAPPSEVRDSAGNTPLHRAALRLDVDAVRSLLTAGANPNAKNNAGATPLLYGAGHAEVVRLLLEKKADPNAKSAAGNTPLMACVIHNPSAAAARLLLDAGADIIAVAPGLRGAPTTLFQRAITGGDPETIKLLIERGADPHAPGTTYLPAAATIGDRETVRLLLDLGADPNRVGVGAGSALNAAYSRYDAATAALLVEHGADLNQRSPGTYRTPPMVWSAYNDTGDATAAKLLVERGVDVNTADDVGETALSYALKIGPDTPLVKYLRSVGATEPGPRKIKPLPARAVPATADARAAMIRESAQHSIDLLQRSSTAYLESPYIRNVAKCISCHHQNLPAIAFDLGRERGLSVDERAFGQQIAAQIETWTGAPRVAALEVAFPFPDSTLASYGLLGLRAARYQADGLTDAIVHSVLRRQQPNGSWTKGIRRPPIGDGELTATALTIGALKAYSIDGREAEVAASIRQARQWLDGQQASSHNETVMQLLGLGWSGEDAKLLQPHVAKLVQSQRPDGGWAQLPGRDSDAFATGTALYALHCAGGLSGNDPVYQRGVEFLLRTQFDDGSWWVRSRSWPLQPHFDSGFPHGKDQWISAAGTAWAASALLLVLEPQTPAKPLPTGQQLMAAYATHAAAERKELTSDAASPVSSSGSAVEFARDIKPILERSCVGCHSGQKPRGAFDLASRDALLKGGQSGEPAIIPGHAEESPLIQFVSGKIEDLEMPPLARREKYPALSSAEIARLRAWVDAGAPWPLIKTASANLPSSPSRME